MANTPVFSLTPLVLTLSQDITYILGRLEGAKLDVAPMRLRRENCLRTIQASCAIEGNTLTLDQVTALFEGKRVIGPSKDIQEIKNTFAVYESLENLNPVAIEDLLRAHRLLMQDLIMTNGQWRTRGVGVFKGASLVHLAPPAHRVPELMTTLFDFLTQNTEISWLLKACIFHYELELIHPFEDGNGRMGRLWQQLILMRENPMFTFIPVEAPIKEKQEAYYDVLAVSNKAGSATPFMEFSLTLIRDALSYYQQTARSSVKDPLSRLQYAQKNLSRKWFARKDYMVFFKEISAPTASRDLKAGVDGTLLEQKGEGNQVMYRFLKDSDAV